MENNSYSEYKIAAVVVTYNRMQLLKECIQSLRNQTRKLDAIIVVNNLSTDNTLTWLNEQNDLLVITQPNSGSAGGQYTGIKTAYENGYDWIWCMDDDVVTRSNALEMLLLNVSTYDENIGFLCSKVIDVNGELHSWNRPGYFWNKNYWNFIGDEEIKRDTTKIDVCSFVGILLNAKLIPTILYPHRGFFLYFDDLEYTLRYRKYNNYFISSSVIIHYSNVFNESIILSVRKSAFLYFRNFVFIYWRHNKYFMIKSLIRIFIQTKIKTNIILTLPKAVLKGIRGVFE